MTQTDQTIADAVSGGDDLIAAPETPKLNLEVKVETKSACERHVTVTISEQDIQRYFAKQFDDLMPRAAVPGFRPGRAPRKLVEKSFREQVSDQVKGSLLLDSMTQVNDEQTFSAISEPDFDFEAIKIPDSGPLTYEFNIEVRPEFDLPNWKGLALDRFTVEIPDSEVDRSLRRLLESKATLVPVDGAAQPGDKLEATITVRVGDRTVAEGSDVTLGMVDELIFPEATIEGFAKLMAGVKAGDERTAQVTLSEALDDEALAGKQADITIKVLDVKRLELPPIDDSILSAYGIESEAAFRDMVRESLRRRVEYQSTRAMREQISNLLTDSAKWELPAGLLKRQFRRDLERAVLELRSNGFDEQTIRAYENDLRQNTYSRTRKLLQEHFILERIAEEEKVEETAADYDMEIALIAAQQNDSPRRVRARLERRGQMDALRNQIIERKVLEMIKAEATFTDKPYEFPGESEGVEFSLIGSTEADIPEARYEDAQTPAGTTAQK